ncbi:MAG TPA: ferric reductase-like transmembrane domain-containing protein [Candidatus Dormibacteraeota bacterium]|nr:ferric reductase-like transmembrane domain-containing protein [Candidatus Dormibacteraeota bacterium]
MAGRDADVTPASPLWYITRGAGFVSLIFLTLSFVLGILTTAQFAPPRLPRFLNGALHRNVALAAVLFAALHVITSILDPFAHLGVLDATVPFASAYRPLWLGLGVVSGELFLILIVTSLVRQWIGHRLWRAIHWAAYAAWPLAIVHGLGTGSDEKALWSSVIYFTCLATVVLAISWRLLGGSPESREARVAGGWALGAAVLAFGVWAMTGPLQPGWAQAAGTPTALLKSSSPGTVGAVAASPTPSPAAGLPRGLDHQLTGQVIRNGSALEVDFVDQTDSNYQVRLGISGDDAQTAAVQVLKGGSVICQATLQQGSSGLVGSCGGTSVQLLIGESTRRSVSAELVTS